jgi:hypothetical protein
MPTWRLRWIAIPSFVLTAVVCTGCPGKPEVKSTINPPGNVVDPAVKQPQPAPQPANLPVPSVQILSVGFQREGGSGTLQLAPMVQNSGPGMAEVNGSCQWRCLVPTPQVSGGLGLASAEFLGAGQRRTLVGNGAVVCGDNPAPVQLSCNFTVRPVDSTGTAQGAGGTVSWSGQAAIPQT